LRSSIDKKFEQEYHSNDEDEAKETPNIIVLNQELFLEQNDDIDFSKSSSKNQRVQS